MEEIFNILIQNKISPNQHYMLYCLRNKIQPTGINPYAEGRDLKFKGYVNDKWELQPKSIELLDKIDEFFSVKKEETSKVIAGNNFKENIIKYLDLFPKRKLPSGKLARSDKKNIENNFRWFFKTFDYDWDIVLKSRRHDVCIIISKLNSNTLNCVSGLREKASLIIWSLIKVLPAPGLPPITFNVFHSMPLVVASLNLDQGV